MLKLVHLDSVSTPRLQTEVDPETGLLKSVNIGSVIHSKKVGGLECFVSETDVEGVYSFGAKQLADGVDHKAGYVWSSRCSVMNQLFNTELIEVCINSRWFGMDVHLLRDLAERDLNRNYSVTMIMDDKGEVRYRLD